MFNQNYHATAIKTDKIHPSLSLVCCHGKESGSSFRIMKLLYNLVVGEMIYICVRVDHDNCFVNWEPTTPHKRLSWLGHTINGPIKPYPWHLSEALYSFVISLRESPFFFFSPEWTDSADRFSAHLLLCPSTSVGNSSTSSPLSASTFTCTSVDRNAASISHFSSLFGASWVEEICRKPMAVLALKHYPNSS